MMRSEVISFFVCTATMLEQGKNWVPHALNEAAPESQEMYLG